MDTIIFDLFFYTIPINRELLITPSISTETLFTLSINREVEL